MSKCLLQIWGFLLNLSAMQNNIFLNFAKFPKRAYDILVEFLFTIHFYYWKASALYCLLNNLVTSKKKKINEIEKT